MSGTRSIEVKFARGLLEFELSSATTLSSGCILLDNSMVALFFRGCPDKENFQNWIRVLTILSNIAVYHNVASYVVIYVNHVLFRPDPSSYEWVTVPFLSRVCSRSPTVRLWLE
ncbi:hypothetical protein KIN20_004638 [Parelaphostrongylus tenuis]|uniref:Uncharacterized protein n=1 Tax=Parelaphostrongylus tenuis TaxID=148309 RepID=A0AAD5MRN5_PARTN|nr:hypothetical protein KIN20_004638 [Parelaphostrongylus tenuis]